MLTRFIMTGLALLITIGLGFWLSQMGRPYNDLLFDAHRLVALGAAAVGGLTAFHLLRDLSAPVLAWIVLAAATLLVIVLFVSGALMSMEQVDYALTLAVHRVSLLALVVVLAAAGYWLVRGR